MKIPENQIFLENVDLSRIAASPTQEQIGREIDEIIQGIGNHKYLRGYVHLRHPKLCEFSILSPIIQQICDNLLLKNYWAAVALTNFLFEASIKYALIYLDCQPIGCKLDEIHAMSLKKYANQDLIPNLNRCRTLNILSKDDVKRLQLLAQRFRNPFSHADLPQVANSSPCDTMKMYVFSLDGNMESVEQTLNWKKTPIFLFHHAGEYIKVNAEGYFFTIMHYVNKLDLLITEKIKKENIKVK